MQFRDAISNIKSEFINLVRGKGLLNAIVVEPQGDINAWQICLRLKEHGLLAKPTHEHIIRFAPPLIINKDEMDSALNIISSVLE